LSAAVIGPARKPSSANCLCCSSRSGADVGSGDGEGVEGEGAEAAIA